MTFSEFDAELWFAKRLGQLIGAAFTGDTDRAIRRDRCRTAITAAGLEKVVLGRKADGKTETCAEAFQRLYGEALQPKSKGK